MQRNSFDQLPSSKELQDILEAETKRELPKGKENSHYFEFSPLADLANYFGIDSSILTSEYVREDLDQESLLNEGKLFIQKLKDIILNKELLPEDIEILNKVYDYLSEEDPLEKSDLIFVFGAKTPLRIEKAVDIYKEGFSKIILASGRGPYYRDSSSETEAKIYKKIAVDSGVPDDSVVTEEESITIPDNVRASLNLLDEKGIRYDSIILINSPYTQRRGWAHFKKYTDDDVKLIRVNCGTGDNYKRDSWYKNPLGIDVVIGEYFKAKVAVSLNTA